MTQKNYDPSTSLCWYRKLCLHPDPAIDSLAKTFCGTVASWLKMDHSSAIFWFEEADYTEAKQAWRDYPGAKNSPAADPLRDRANIFDGADVRAKDLPDILITNPHWES